MRLTNPCEGLLREASSLVKGHLGRELLNRNGGGMQGSVRVRELVVAIMAMKFGAPCLAIRGAPQGLCAKQR
jgi:hypothetical protein